MEKGYMGRAEREREHGGVTEKEINMYGEKESWDAPMQGARRARGERNTYQQAVAFPFSFGLKFFFLFL